MGGTKKPRRITRSTVVAIYTFPTKYLISIGRLYPKRMASHRYTYEDYLAWKRALKRLQTVAIPDRWDYSRNAMCWVPKVMRI